MGGFDGGENFLCMPLRLYFGKDLQQLLVGPDEEGGALNPNHFLAVHILFLENIKLFADYFVYICKERIGQVVLLSELLLRLRRVTRDTENNGACLLYLLEDVAKTAGFDRTAGSIGPGIEEKHYWFAAEVFQMYGFIFVRLQSEIGDFVV